MSKYNVGDVIKLRDDLEAGKWYNGALYSEGIKYYQNKPVTIKQSVITVNMYVIQDGVLISDEMIEGLWEECKEKQDKLKLIDVLNMIAKGELKEGTRVIWQKMKYIFEDGELEREGDKEAVNIFEDMYCINLNDEEVELIEPPCEHEWLYWETHRIGEGQIRRYRRCEKCGLEGVTEKCIPDEGKTLEPSKIEELDEKVFAECDNIGKCYRLLYKLNEVIRKINEE